MTHRDALDDRTYAELAPVLTEIDQLRRAVLARVLGIGIPVMGITLVIGALALVLLPPAACFVVVVGLVVWSAGSAQAMRLYRREFKQRVIGRLVALHYPDLTYQPDAGIDRATFSHAGLFRGAIDVYTSEDLLSGTLGATTFRCAEVHAQSETEDVDSDGDRTTRRQTIFKGLLFIGDFSKHFAGRTYVVPDVAQAAFGGLGQTLQQATAGLQFPGTALVQLEDPAFERWFAVYGTDQVEARYILSTSLMQRLTTFREAIGASVSLAFIDQQVVVAISRDRAWFEPPPLWRAAPLKPDDLRAWLADVRLAQQIIDDLNLNLRIWSRT